MKRISAGDLVRNWRSVSLWDAEACAFRQSPKVGTMMLVIDVWHRFKNYDPSTNQSFCTVFCDGRTCMIDREALEKVT